MRCFFTIYKEHKVKDIDNIQAVDIIEKEYVIRIRKNGIIVLKNNKTVLDQKL